MNGRSHHSAISIRKHAIFFGTHIGPFMGAYMAMGMEQMFVTYQKDKPFVQAVMETRLAWALAIFQRAVALCAEVIIMGDDAAHRGGPLISPAMWRELVLNPAAVREFFRCQGDWE